MVWGAVIGGGLALGGALLGANAAGDAADEQSAAARNAADASLKGTKDTNATTLQMYNQTRDDTAPWRQAGSTALGQLTAGTQAGGDFNKPFDFTMSDFKADPGYQFTIDQAQKALERSAAAKGTLESGGFMKSLNDYSMNAANQEYGTVYDRAYNRFNTDTSNRFNRLATLAGLGSGANSLTSAAGANASGTIGSANMQGAAGAGSAYLQGGNAAASGIIGSNNALMGGLGNAVNAYTRNNAMQNMDVPQGNAMGSMDNPIVTQSHYSGDYGE